MERNKVRALKLKSLKYFFVDKILYWKDPLGVILRFLDPQEAWILLGKSISLPVVNIDGS
jgi:hypothetical protein